MKLIRLRVENFRCVEDSGEFKIGDLTCLAGKNEAGKTALLLALNRLNPLSPADAKFDPTMDYPRQRLSDFQEGDEPHNVLTTTWELDEEDQDAVATLVGPGAINDNLISISKGYQKESSAWAIDVDEARVVNNLLRRAGLTETARRRLADAKDLDDLTGRITKQASPTKGEQRLLDTVNERWSDATPWVQVRDALVKRLPHFVYFPDYRHLPGRVSFEQLTAKLDPSTPQQLNDEDELFLALLEQARTSVEEIRDEQLSESLKAKLEGLSNRISREIFEYWSQNRDLKVEFDYREGLPQDPSPFNHGHVFHTRIENRRHGVTVGFDERSTGFIWFFSFLVWFSQAKSTYGDRLVLLLDEPALHLHGKAQADLLRYIKEKLVPSFQTIYTTHSPFMVDTDNLLSVRTVEDVTADDGTILGTKVEDDVLSTDPDTVFPLRAALGYDMTQSLFVGENSLLVEGPSDFLYLRWASRELEKRGRTGLDRRWTITPVGGLDKVGAFASLFGGNNLRVAVLTDFRKGVKKKVRTLLEHQLLEADHVFTVDMFAGSDEADIEDILGAYFYAALINACYTLKAANKLAGNGLSHPVVSEVEAHFRTLSPSDPEFDHYTPAVYLTEHWSDLESKLPGVEDSLDRFANFFDKVNGLLPQEPTARTTT